MATSNKTDQFFREHLDQYEIPPSVSSWGEVKAGIQKAKAKPRWPMLAASVACILGIAGLIAYTWINHSNTRTTMTGYVDHPTPLPNILAISLPDSYVATKKYSEAPTTNRAATKPEGRTTIKRSLLKVYSTNPASRIAILSEVTPPLRNKLELLSEKRDTNEDPHITITYKGSFQEPSTEKKSIFPELKKDHLSPASIFADIRNAKDNLLKRSN